MVRRLRPFLIALAIAAAVAVPANLPHTAGPPRQWAPKAGWPWVFAGWKDGELVWFDPGVLAANVAVWSGLAFCCACLIVLSAAWSVPPARAADGAEKPTKRVPDPVDNSVGRSAVDGQR